MTVTPAFLTVGQVCLVLGLKRNDFMINYLRRFTDGRPLDKRRSGVPHRIRRSEVELVVSDGWEALAQKRAAPKGGRKT